MSRSRTTQYLFERRERELEAERDQALRELAATKEILGDLLEERGLPREHEVSRVLVVSTAHVTSDERVRLWGLDGDAPRAQLVGEYGAMLWVPPPASGGVVFEEDSEGLASVLEIARGLNCYYVLFDQDGPQYRSVPEYD